VSERANPKEFEHAVCIRRSNWVETF